jgi:hypothetical protein
MWEAASARLLINALGGHSKHDSIELCCRQSIIGIMKVRTLVCQP